MAHVDRCAEHVQRPFDDFYGTVDAGTVELDQTLYGLNDFSLGVTVLDGSEALGSSLPVTITVTDDGHGFSTAEVSERPTAEGGFGLFSIRERMADLGGSLNVESAPGGGCTAVLCMPVDRLTRKD